MELQIGLDKPLAFPCSVKSSDSHLYVGGSATSQAIAAARCGAKVSLVGTIGSDIFGKTILNTLRHEGIQTSGIVKSELPTSIITSIINPNGQKASIALDGANMDISFEQIPNSILNEKTLLMLQNDIVSSININILKRTKAGNAKSIMCLNHSNNIDNALFDDLDIAIVNDNILVPKNKNTQIILTEHKNNAFDAFCGCFGACIQARINIDKAIEYGNSAAELTTGNNFPYLGNIEDNLKNPKSSP